MPDQSSAPAAGAARRRLFVRVHRRRLAIVSAAVVAAAGLVASTPQQEPKFLFSGVTVEVGGNAAAVRASITAKPSTRVSSYSVCVRSSTGANVDFEHRHDATLASTGTTYQGTRTLPDGTYSYYGCVLYAGHWLVLGSPTTFQVGATTAGATAASATASPTSSATTPASGAESMAPTAGGRTPPATTSPNTPPAPGSSSAASPKAPSATSSASGSMPVGDLPGWTQVFADDFTTPVALGGFTSSGYSQRWFGYSGYKDTSGRGWYAPDKVVSVTNGTLDWYVHTQNGVHYVAAMVPKVPASGWGQQYGRYSFRFRADTIPGYKMVAILWPDGDNWGQGEVDFPEVSALTSNEKMYANMYAKGNTATGTPGPASRFTTVTSANATGWHIATIDWAPGSLTTWLDGSKLGTFTAGVPDAPFHLVFQVETNLYSAAPVASVSGHIQLDWVTMYSRTP